MLDLNDAVPNRKLILLLVENFRTTGLALKENNLEDLKAFELQSDGKF